MIEEYRIKAKKFKALSDANRLQIIEILSCGEKCACDILEYVNFTQSTLSHHMKVLTDCELVKCRKEGLWSHYSLTDTGANRELLSFINSNSESAV